MDLAAAASECRRLLGEAALRKGGDSILLSGGLDTTIIAHLVAEKTRPKCFTVFFPQGQSPDVPFARSVARRLGLDWELLELTPDLLEERLPEVIRVLHTFDPMEVRNSVVQYHGLLAARQGGYRRVLTGDGADELFAGYSFAFNLDPETMRKKLRALWKIMRFSSRPMAESLGIEASIPFLDGEVVRLAKKLGPEQMVGRRGGRTYGKLILRIAFEGVIGKRYAWRIKTPIEYGSGTTHLPEYYSRRVRDASLLSGRARALREGVKIRDKEHLRYYTLYREMFPPPRETAASGLRCPDCGGDARPDSTFCVRCGAYPIEPASADPLRPPLSG